MRDIAQAVAAKLCELPDVQQVHSLENERAELRSKVGHNYIGHNSIDHNYIMRAELRSRGFHTYMGHNYIDHNYISQTF